MKANDCKTILVVEDDDNVRQFALTFLSHHGFRTLEAVDGQSGVACFLQHRDEIDLILTDIMMPYSGTEMADDILRADPTAKIVFMSGTAGVIAFPPHLKRFSMLHKPFTADVLLQAILSALGEGERHANFNAEL